MRYLRSFVLGLLSSRLVQAFVDVVEPAVARLAREKRWVAVETDQQDLMIYRIAKDEAKLVGSPASLSVRDTRTLRGGRNVNLELRIPADRLIKSTFDIPSDAVPFIASVIEGRLDRLTPWKPEKVIYGFALAPKAGVNGQTEVLFAATSRDIGTASLARLAEVGFVPSRLGSAGEPLDKALRIDLLRGENDGVHLRRRRSIATGAMSSVFVTICAFCISVYLSTATAGRMLETQDALTQLRVRIVGGSGMATDRQRQADILAEKTPDRATFSLIDRLAIVIPDTTYLDALDIAADNVRIGGLSSDAAGLIPLLEHERSFSQATFTAPVIRQDNGLDRFDITIKRATAKPEATR